jgi:hypothetical protein
MPSTGNSAPQDVAVAGTDSGRAELLLGAGVTPILPLHDQQGARRPHSMAIKHRGPPRPNHANRQSQKSRARDLLLQLATPS